MKVKIGDKIYDGRNEPVMVILSERDKDNIKSMDLGLTKYCSYPDGTNIDIDKWMKTDD